MLKSSSLYLVIIVSTVIAILTASLISVAYFYRLENQKNQRYSKLQQNLESGIAIALSKDFKSSNSLYTLDLFGLEDDSISLLKEDWGFFQTAAISSFISLDTLRKAFLIAKEYNSRDVAIYLSDEDRPLSVGGDTRISGTAILPKSGIRAAYANGKPYTGKELVFGEIKVSRRAGPALAVNLISDIEKMFESPPESANAALPSYIDHSFFEPTQLYDLSGRITELTNHILTGKIILFSDTTIRVSATANLQDILVYAPVIEVADGFQGSCQLFASDSIVVGKNAVFNYPSVLAVVKPANSQSQSKIELKEGTRFSGILLTHEKQRSALQTMISIGSESKINGEIYSTGFIKLDKSVEVRGKLTCNRFIMKTKTTLFENFLIDVSIDGRGLSDHYLSSGIFNGSDRSNEILTWVN